jgi:hypothetical protein
MLDDRSILVLDLVVAEVLKGMRDAWTLRRTAAFFRQLPFAVVGGLDLAEASAQNYRTLRAKGITVRNTIDCLIATYCIRERHTLLHNDRDFDHFERELGLQVVRA